MGKKRSYFWQSGSPLFCREIKTAKIAEMMPAKLEIAERICRKRASASADVADVLQQVTETAIVAVSVRE